MHGQLGVGRGRVVLPLLQETDVIRSDSWADPPPAPRESGPAAENLQEQVTADMAIVAAFGRDVPTVDLRVDYHRATVKEELRAVGRTIKIGRTLATAEATIYNSDDKLVASGRGVFLTQKVEGA